MSDVHSVPYIIIFAVFLDSINDIIVKTKGGFTQFNDWSEGKGQIMKLYFFSCDNN